MKKGLTLFATLLITSGIAVTSAKAENLKDKVAITNTLGVGNVEFVRYDTNTNINHYKATITLNDAVKEKVLEQHPGQVGDEASISTFYVGMKPTLNAKEDLYKMSFLEYYEDAYNTEKLKTLLDTLNQKMATETDATEPEFWVTYLKVQYTTDGGKTWITSTDKSDGRKTIEQYLQEKTGKSTLVYGKDYRFYMSEIPSRLLGWEYKNTNDEVAHEYISVSYDIEFPIFGHSNGKVFYPSIKDAIEAGETWVSINEDVTISDPSGKFALPGNVHLTIEEGVTVTVATGTEFKMESYTTSEGNYYGSSIENNGTLIINGKMTTSEDASIYNSERGVITTNGNLIIDGWFDNDGKVNGVVTNTEGKTYYYITREDVENGYIGLTGNAFATGSKVYVWPWVEDESLEIDTITVLDKNGKAIVVSEDEDGYYFEMPESDVTISATFRPIPKTPDTYDGITLYYMSGIISLFGLMGASLYLKKRMN